jgi:hypothetical protein
MAKQVRLCVCEDGANDPDKTGICMNCRRPWDLAPGEVAVANDAWKDSSILRLEETLAKLGAALEQVQENLKTARKMMEQQWQYLLAQPCPKRPGGGKHEMEGGFGHCVGKCRYCGIDGGTD